MKLFPQGHLMHAYFGSFPYVFLTQRNLFFFFHTDPRRNEKSQVWKGRDETLEGSSTVLTLAE
jgi:hypothetical protein